VQSSPPLIRAYWFWRAAVQDAVFYSLLARRLAGFFAYARKGTILEVLVVTVVGVFHNVNAVSGTFDA